MTPFQYLFFIPLFLFAFFCTNFNMTANISLFTSMTIVENFILNICLMCILYTVISIFDNYRFWGMLVKCDTLIFVRQE
jgi:hypothetical protein